MDYKIFYTNRAQRDLAEMDKPLALKILKKMDYFAKLPDPMSVAVKLSGFKIPTFRFRVGDYRIVFRKDIEKNCLVILVVLKISHRKEIYRKSK